MKYVCENCGAIFGNESECLDHENDCNKTNKYFCYCCGRKDELTRHDIFKLEVWHNIYLGRLGFGSNFDGLDVDFWVCDDCLYNWVDGFIHKERIYDNEYEYKYNCSKKID